MSKIIKRTAALVCAALIMVSISACGEKTETKESSAVSETTSAASTEAATEKATAEVTTESAASNTEAATTAAKAASTDSDIVGSWEYEGGSFTYTFNDNGTGTYDISGNVMNFTYSADGTKLTITYEGSAAMELSYELNGDTLNVKDSTGSDTIYKRK